jgi:hypothetical protein
VPRWFDRPAVTRLTVSSAWHLAAFAQANRGRPYAEQVKQFNFMLSAPLAHQGRPVGIELDEPFRLVAPFETDGRRWERMAWTSLYSGRSYGVTTDWPGGGEGVAGVNALGTVAEAYPFHPEPKRAAQDGRLCTKQWEGLPVRRKVQGAGTVRIGKEAHRLEDRELVADLGDLLSTYADPRRDPWTIEYLPRLRTLAREAGGMSMLGEVSGLSQRALRDVLAGRSQPREQSKRRLVALAKND